MLDHAKLKKSSHKTSICTTKNRRISHEVVLTKECFNLSAHKNVVTSENEFRASFEPFSNNCDSNFLKVTWNWVWSCWVLTQIPPFCLHPWPSKICFCNFMRLFLKFPVKSYKNQTIVGKFIAEKTIYKNQFCPFQHYSQAWAWYLSVNQLVNLMWFYLQPKFYDYLLSPWFFITGYWKIRS